MKKKPQTTRKVTREEAHTRFDKCLRLWIPHLPQSLIEKAARKGLVQVDGAKAKPSQRVEEGQTLLFPEEFLLIERGVEKRPLKSLAAEDKKWLKSLILYEDAALMVLNKPAGIAVQGGTKQHKSLDTMMKAYDEKTKTRLVHRLDRDTSGLLVFAKSLPVARVLTRAFKERKVTKIYWALVCGVPKQKEGQIILPLSKKQDVQGEKVRVDMKEGVKAVTSYRVLEALGRKMAWLELIPQTGRTHQLRVHCAEGLKTPILGDGKYGGKEAYPFGRVPLHLHARSLTIPYPQGKTMSFEAPLPKVLQETFDEYGFGRV